MKNATNLLAIVAIAVLAMLSITSCGNQKKAADPSLSGEQQMVCDFIVKMFGEPVESYDRPDWDNLPSPAYYHGDEIVTNHCSSELQKRLMEAYNSEFGYDGEYEEVSDRKYLTEMFGIGFEGDYEFMHHAVECIHISKDWYTYVFYDKGEVGYHKIHATVENGTVIIDEISDFGETAELWGEEHGETWIRAGWTTTDNNGNTSVLVFNSILCLVVDFSLNEPSFQVYPYTINGDQVSLTVNNGEVLLLEKKSDVSMVQSGTKTTLNKIIGKPFIFLAD